jgi:hypothetical protein
MIRAPLKARYITVFPVPCRLVGRLYPVSIVSRCNPTPAHAFALDSSDSCIDSNHSTIVAAVSRRRQVLSAFAASALGGLGGGQGPQGPKRARPKFSWAAHVQRLTTAEFRHRYRLTPEAFYKLLQVIEDLLVVQNHRQAKNSIGAIIPPEVKLAAALRFFAGGQVLDLKLIYNMSIYMVYACVWLVVDAVNQRLQIHFPIKDVYQLSQLEAEFAANARQQVWRGQVMAIDGVHFKMEKPSKKVVKDGGRYFVARKDEFALLCVAGCDYRRRFLFYDISVAATTHDSLAFAVSELGQAVANGELPEPFFINGDNAFVQSNSMMVPANDPSLDDYDFEQSSNRMPIECAFGVLVRRWGILWRSLKVAFHRRAPLIGEPMLPCMHTCTP